MRASWRSMLWARAKGSRRARSACSSAAPAGACPGPASRRSRGVCWGLVAAADAGAHARFAQQLDRGQEEVLQQAQVPPVERVNGGLGHGGVVAHIAEEFADVGPVLLLDVGVVVLLIGPPAGELDLLGLAVIPPVLIDELRAVG